TFLFKKAAVLHDPIGRVQSAHGRPCDSKLLRLGAAEPKKYYAQDPGRSQEENKSPHSCSQKTSLRISTLPFRAGDLPPIPVEVAEQERDLAGVFPNVLEIRSLPTIALSLKRSVRVAHLVRCPHGKREALILRQRLAILFQRLDADDIPGGCGVLYIAG